MKHLLWIRRVSFVLITALALLPMGCVVEVNENSEEESKELEPLDTTALKQQIQKELQEENQIGSGPIDELIAKRRAAGDTTVLTKPEIQELAHTDYKDYQAGALNTLAADMPEQGGKLSEVSYKLRKGGKRIEVTISDLNGYPQNLKDNYLFHHNEIQVERENGYTNTYVMQDGVRINESVDRAEKTVEISAFVGNRFTVQLKGKGFRSSDTLKDYLRSLPLKQMLEQGDVLATADQQGGTGESSAPDSAQKSAE